VRIGYLGRVGRAKGVDVLGEACGLLDPALRERVELVVAGDDRFMPPSDQAAVDRALDASGVSVTRLGWQSRETFFETTDLAVFPSVWEEPFGLVVAEAMEARCPVVVSDAGALPEVVGATYPWTAPRGDARALADVLTRAITELPAAELTQTMRSRWVERFSPEAGRRHLAALLDSWGLA
jgi:glycosyltransferase involved in cell wall biosynthesis